MKSRVADKRPTLIEFIKMVGIETGFELQPYQEKLLNHKFTVKKHVLNIRPINPGKIAEVMASASIGKISSAHISSNNLDIIQEVNIHKNER